MTQAQQLLEYIDSSPSPWHVVESTVALLQAHGFKALSEKEIWQLNAGERYYTIRDQSSIIAFIAGSKAPSESGYRIIGAHTDSPGLRIKPNPEQKRGAYLRLGVEVYGGPILATFADRDLSLAGRVSIKTGRGAQAFESRLLRINESIVRLPNLAIHLNREVNKSGLKFNPQDELPLIFSQPGPDGGSFKGFIAERLQVNETDILAWELAAYDTQPGAFSGLDQAFITNSQLDNLASCHAALLALTKILDQSNPATQVIAFFDHEEVGSSSAKGADGSFLSDVLHRISTTLDDTTQGHHQAIAHSYMLSADMAHAWHPNFSHKHEPEHQPIINAGPVIKINTNQRYTTNAHTEALFVSICEDEKIPHQKFVNRSDLACGSTIGPMSAARTGIRSLDVGNPMWAMHSIRESAGAADHHYMIGAMSGFLRC
ncbi:MAG: M18 family aminopeptidase [Gammaproteobacteria bacterium]|nr:M18 family aminopeptidase [Gammaproteobacteria bacterium]